MTIDELQERGYKFTVFHHKNEIEVRISLKRAWIKTSTGASTARHVGSCAAAYRADAMEMARQRAAVDLVTRRLSA